MKKSDLIIAIICGIILTILSGLFHWPCAGWPSNWSCESPPVPPNFVGETLNWYGLPLPWFCLGFCPTNVQYLQLLLDVAFWVTISFGVVKVFRRLT